MSSNTKLVEVYRACGELEALAVKAKLESYGIPAVLSSHAAGSVHVFAVDGLGEVRIMVTQEDYHRARDLIDAGEEQC